MENSGWISVTAKYIDDWMVRLEFAEKYGYRASLRRGTWHYIIGPNKSLVDLIWEVLTKLQANNKNPLEIDGKDSL